MIVTLKPSSRSGESSTADARTASADVVDLRRHPAFLCNKISRDMRDVRHQVAEARASLDRIHVALSLFRVHLAESRARLTPIRADCAATLAALESGDVAEMERVRDAILARMNRRPG